MRLLLNTHTLLWFLPEYPRLGTAAKTTLEERVNERWLSPISLLEIAIKVRLAKLDFGHTFATMFPEALVVNRIQLLAIESRHVETLFSLPLHHCDPFARLLAATSIVDDLTLVSADAAY